MAETYSTVALSTGHLTIKDAEALGEAARAGDSMVAQRPTGFFIKIYRDGLHQNLRHGVSDQIRAIMEWAFNNGFGMVEFDAAAPSNDNFLTFEW